MLEYVFFDHRPYERFVAFATEQGLAPVCRAADDVFEVALPEDLESDLNARIEAYYDEMMALNQALYESGDGRSDDDYHAAGVVVNLQDGRAVYAEVEPRLLGRVMAVLSPQEFGSIVDAIVAAVERPDPRTFCQRMRDGD